ncbi:phenylacetate--CoA ligase family protein [Bradyrhizobium sp. CAR08]
MNLKVEPIDVDRIPAQIRFDYHQRSLLDLWHRGIRHPGTREQFPLGATQPTLTEIELAWKQIGIRDSYDHSAYLDLRLRSEAGEPSAGSDIVFSSGGSTRKAKTLIGTYEETLYNARFHGKGYHLTGVNSDDTVLALGGHGTYDVDYCVFHGLSQTGCAIIPINDYRRGQEIAEIMRELRATAILALPSGLYSLLGHLEDNNVTYSGVRLIVTGGEPLSRQLRERLVQRFGSNLSFGSVFQTSDHGTIGFQCPFCSSAEYHVHEGLIYVELDARREDGLKELVISNLYRSRMPVVRLRTGDFAEWTDPEGSCSCGLTSRKLRILGRVTHPLELGSAMIDAKLLSELPERVGVHENQINVLIRKDELNRDLLEIAISNELRGKHGRAIEEHLLSIGSVATGVKRGWIVGPNFVPPLEAHEKTSGYGKLRVVIDFR